MVIYHWAWKDGETFLRFVRKRGIDVEIYEQSVGRGAQLMLGLAPDRRGLLPEADVKRLQEFGETVRHGYRDNLVARRVQTTNAFAEALDGDPDTFWSAAPGNRQATIEVQFAKPVTFDRALTMEWLNQGQHVEHYRIESWDGKAWKAVTEGHPIGHKKIDVFAPVTASRVRLKILGASGEIGIREFQLYRAGR